MLIVAVGCLVTLDKLVLCQRRPAGMALANCWELPGGKVEEGELMRAALQREWQEELGVQILVHELLDEQIVPFPQGPVLLPLFRVELLTGEVPRPLIDQEIASLTLEDVLARPCVPSMPLFAPAIARLLGG